MDKPGHYVVDDSIGISLLLALSYKKEKRPYIVVCSNLYKAQKIYDFLLTFIDKDNVLLFPGDELIRAEALAQSKELLSSRLYALSKLEKDCNKIVITNIAGIARYLPNPQLFYNNILHFKVGGTYSLSQIKHQLIEAGYSLVSKVDQSLQFAVRGDILDIFSVNLDMPVRIEFFDDTIESIRFFNIANQMSVEKVDIVDILPASDFILTPDELKLATDKIHSILEKDQKHLDYSTFENLRNLTDTDISCLLENQNSPRLYKYFSFLTDEHYSLLDYFEDAFIVLVDRESLSTSNSMLLEQSMEYLYEMSSEGKIISHLQMYQNAFDVISLSRFKKITTSTLPINQDSYSFVVSNVPYQASKQSDTVNIIHNYLNDGYIICISLPSKEQMNITQELLLANKLPYEIVHDFELPKKHKISLSLTNLNRGFLFKDEKLVFLTSNELYNEKVKVSRFDNRFKKATILNDYEDLQPGDYVVHEYQGIGQFLELQTLEVDGIHRDYLKIAYYGGELLYVPLAQFQLVRKYMGKEGIKPRISHLHSKDWENTKKRIKERIDDLANRLFNLYVERNKVQGYSFQEDDEFQKEFEDSCPFELTKDQIKAVDEIKRDMESSHPMDRLLCGDVGFGKTEVAFRAIMKAILSGKQAAMLCPTTLLARQHFERALERFAGFDVKIAVFSRLINDKVQKQYIKEIAEGKIHLVIGTHRLLNKEIVFKDLGLLVVDEEQRFGVEQKERLKELKTNIDVLTLSATPIPRTLQISLLGVRSMSIINTAPQERMPIQTYVIPYKEEIVKELIERELGRKGQAFYLHNNVSTLYMCSNKIHKMLPDARIGVAHGQMDKNDIEDVMMKFYGGEIDILVCTSIIENGIDIPNANMIIVEDSDYYGLSQLYQIKGRVGRSDRIAYAYLMYNEYKVLNEKAQKRLQAIQDFTELGSGYKIAQRDLMIRGAGDILGPEQAGYIDSIGLDMYIKLLNEAVKDKIDQKEGILPEEAKANLTLKIDAYIPKEYAGDSDKIELYQEILGASSTESLMELKQRTRDIFGKLPPQVELLYVKRNIDLLLKQANITTVKENPTNVEIYLGEPYINIKGIGNILFESLIPYISRLKVSYINHKFKIVINKTQSMLTDMEGILYGLVNITENHKTKVIV